MTSRTPAVSTWCSTDTPSRFGRLAAELRVPLIDVHRSCCEYAENEGSQASLLLDGMHPNARGHQLVAAELTPLASAALKRRASAKR